MIANHKQLACQIQANVGNKDSALEFTQGISFILCCA